MNPESVIYKAVSLRAKLQSLGQWNELTDLGREAVNEVVNEARDYIDQSTLDSKVTAARGVA